MIVLYFDYFDTNYIFQNYYRNIMKTVIKHEEVTHLVMKTYEFLEQIG